MNLTSYYRGFKYFILSIRVVDAQNNVESFFSQPTFGIFPKVLWWSDTWRYLMSNETDRSGMSDFEQESGIHEMQSLDSSSQSGESPSRTEEPPPVIELLAKR